MQPMQPAPAYYAPMPQPRRSAIPKVMGILMIVFGSIGILGAFISLALKGRSEFSHVPEWQTVETISLYMALLVALPMAAFQLTTGIISVKYKASAPKVATILAIAKMVMTVVEMIVTYKYTMAALEVVFGERGRLDSFVRSTMETSMKIGMVFGGIVGLAWPILILILMNRPAAKAACMYK